MLYNREICILVFRMKKHCVISLSGDNISILLFFGETVQRKGRPNAFKLVQSTGYETDIVKTGETGCFCCFSVCTKDFKHVFKCRVFTVKIHFLGCKVDGFQLFTLLKASKGFLYQLSKTPIPSKRTFTMQDSYMSTTCQQDILYLNEKAERLQPGVGGVR